MRIFDSLLRHPLFQTPSKVHQPHRAVAPLLLAGKYSTGKGLFASVSTFLGWNLYLLQEMYLKNMFVIHMPNIDGKKVTILVAISATRL